MDCGGECYMNIKTNELIFIPAVARDGYGDGQELFGEDMEKVYYVIDNSGECRN